MKYLTLYQGTAPPFRAKKFPPQVTSWPGDTTVVQSVLKDKALLFILLFLFFFLDFFNFCLPAWRVGS